MLATAPPRLRDKGDDSLDRAWHIGVRHDVNEAAAPRVLVHTSVCIDSQRAAFDAHDGFAHESEERERIMEAETGLALWNTRHPLSLAPVLEHRPEPGSGLDHLPHVAV
jgi:hypothetical protein